MNESKIISRSIVILSIVDILLAVACDWITSQSMILVVLVTALDVGMIALGVILLVKVRNCEKGADNNDGNEQKVNYKPDIRALLLFCGLSVLLTGVALVNIVEYPRTSLLLCFQAMAVGYAIRLNRAIK